MNTYYKSFSKTLEAHTGGKARWQPAPNGSAWGEWTPPRHALTWADGYHVYTIGQLLNWLTPRVYIVEGRGAICHEKLYTAVRQLRLGCPVSDWNPSTATALACDFIDHMLSMAWEPVFPGDSRPAGYTKAVRAGRGEESAREGVVAAIGWASGYTIAAYRGGESTRLAARKAILAKHHSRWPHTAEAIEEERALVAERADQAAVNRASCAESAARLALRALDAIRVDPWQISYIARDIVACAQDCRDSWLNWDGERAWQVKQLATRLALAQEIHRHMWEPSPVGPPNEEHRVHDIQ